MGAYLASVHFTAIYASTLERASLTAEAIKSQQKDPNLEVYKDDLLREQYFGTGEGMVIASKHSDLSTMKAHYAKGIFPAIQP